MQLTNHKTSHIKNLLTIIFSAVLFSCITHLFYCYINGIYLSDFPSHIATVLEGRAKYSLMHRLISLCYLLPYPDFVLSILMSLLILGTALGMWLYIVKRLNAGTDFIQSDNIQIFKKMELGFIAVSLLFTSNIYIPILFPSLYCHYTKVSQPWHNSTYILMRFWSVFVIYTYFQIYEKLKKNEFKFYNGIWFCILLTLCNFSKPNFFLAFAPTVLIVLFLILFKEKGRNLRELISFGCIILLSMPILFYQMQIVYDEAEKSSIALSLECFQDYIYGIPGKILVYEISNLCFPLFVGVVFLALKFVKHQNIEFDRLAQGGLLFIIAHLQQLLMIDQGPRADAGNYAWGVYAYGMLLFMICITEWISAYKKKLFKGTAIFKVGLCIYALHILCGIIYFINLCQGGRLFI